MEGDVTPSLTSYRSVVILSSSALVTLSLYLTYFPFRTVCVLPARLYRTLWPTPPPILVRTVCASSQATPAYSGYNSHTHTWPLQVELLDSIMGTRESAGLRSYSSLRPLHRIDNAQLYVHYQVHSVITKLAASASSLANAR